MKNNNLFLGADFGTQGVRVGLVNQDGKIIASNEVKYPIHYPKSGYAVQDSSDWWKGFKEALTTIIGDYSAEEKNNIKALSICATSSTVLPVDREGNALDEAMMWMDIRSKEQAKRINETSHSVLGYCGDAVSPEWFIPKLLWIKENNQLIYENADKIVEQIDFINHKLTGNWATSKVNAVCKWNYVDGEGFNEEYMSLIGLEDYQNKMVTSVMPMGEQVGCLNQSLANEFGLNNIPVIQGGIDAHIGMVGMGVVAPGKMAAIMGTSFVQLLFTDKDLPIKGIWGPYKEAMVPGLTLLEAGQISAGSIIKWYQNIFDINDGEAFRKMQEEARNIPVGADGIRALDFFQGNRTPYKDNYATGSFHGLTLNHSRAHLHRAIMEAVAFGFKNIIENFEQSGVPINKVIGTGGVTQDKLWMQIIADATGKEFIINDNTNYGTILGCAILGAVGSGLYSSLEQAADKMVHEKETIYPNKDNTKAYNRPFKEYLELYHSLKIS